MKRKAGIIFLFLMALALLSCVFFSCNTERKGQRRLQKLLRQHPELMSRDTVRIRDTVYTTYTQTDTVVHYTQLRDTVVLEKNNLQVKIYEYRDSIFITGEVRPDTIIREHVVTRDKVIFKEDPSGSGPPLFYWLIFALVVILFLAIGLIRVIKGKA